MKRICHQCRTSFEPEESRGEVQCPKCGALQEDLESPRFGNSEDRTEFASAPRAESTMVEMSPAPEPEHENTPTGDEEFFNQPTQARPTAKASPKAEKPTPELLAKVPSVAQTFGPTLLVTALFLSWIAYDKLLRARPACTEEVAASAAIPASSPTEPHLEPSITPPPLESPTESSR